MQVSRENLQQKNPMNDIMVGIEFTKAMTGSWIGGKISR